MLALLPPRAPSDFRAGGHAHNLEETLPTRKRLSELWLSIGAESGSRTGRVRFLGAREIVVPHGLGLAGHLVRLPARACQHLAGEVEDGHDRRAAGWRGLIDEKLVALDGPALGVATALLEEGERDIDDKRAARSEPQTMSEVVLSGDNRGMTLAGQRGQVGGRT